MKAKKSIYSAGQTAILSGVCRVLLPLIIASAHFSGCLTGSKKEKPPLVYQGPPSFDVPGPQSARDTLKAATLNMYIGFPVEDLAFFPFLNDSGIVKEMDRLLGIYKSVYPAERARIIAEKIAALDADVVGLQEVMAMYIKDTLHTDFMETVKAVLQEKGASYQTYFTPVNRFTIGPYTFKGDTANAVFYEGNALLVKSGYTVLDTAHFVYSENLEINLLGEKKASERNSAFAAILSPKGKRYHVFCTHIEIAGLGGIWERYQKVQVSDLLDIADSLHRPGVTEVILADLNSEIDSAIYKMVAFNNWVDTHKDLPTKDTATCCVIGWNDPVQSFGNRHIDYVFARGLSKVLSGDVTLKQKGRVGDISVHASDHRMVVSQIEAAVP